MSEKNMCCERVWPSGTWSRSVPCKKSAKVERDGKHYCGIHDPVARKEKQAVRNDKLRKKIDEEMRISRIRHAAPDLLEALQKLYANGHLITWRHETQADAEIKRNAIAAIAKATGEQP